MTDWTNADWFLFCLAFIALGRMSYYFRLILEDIRKDDR